MVPVMGIAAVLAAIGVVLTLKLADERRVGELADGPSIGLRAHLRRTLKAKLVLVHEALWGAEEARQIDLDGFDPQQIVPALRRRHRKRGRFPKRAMDILISAALLAFLGPFLLLVAIAIKLDSPGPVFYKQRRTGMNGRVFDVIKFRSMVTDAEKNGAQFASKNDSRVTALGRILRKTRIDEIPQAINVLRGEMSFVGPRPERPEMIETLERHIPHYHDRHAIKPGITGWAQVEYEYGASVEDAREKLKYDLYYIKNFSIVFDLIILLKTVRVTLFGIGAR